MNSLARLTATFNGTVSALIDAKKASLGGGDLLAQPVIRWRRNDKWRKENIYAVP